MSLQANNMNYIKNNFGEKLYYKVHNQSKYNKAMPYVVFLHGYCSSKESTKALYIEDFCIKNNIPFVSFDLSSAGESEGTLEDATIEKWLEDTKTVLESITQGKQKILVGSSLGGWLAMLYCLKYQQEVHSLLCLAPAPDFHVDILNSLTNTQKETLNKQGMVELEKEPGYDKGLSFSLKLLTSAKDCAILNQEKIAIKKPITILQGMKDESVNYNKSIEIINKIESEQAKLILCKNSNHGLSNENDLKEITEQLLNLIKLSSL